MRPRRAPPLRALAVLAVLALGAGVWWAGRAVPAPGVGGAPVGPAVAAPPSPRAAPALPRDEPGAGVAPSLAGTRVAGALPVDAGGHLVVVPEVREWFDWFLAAGGELPPEALRARLEAGIERRLDPPADAEARALLARYLAYREAVRALAEEGGAELDLERRFQRLRELRRAHLGDAAAVFFGAEEARTRVELERRRVARDAGLSAAERAARLEALEAELPAEVRATREAVLAAQRLRAEEAALREAGAGPGEIQALRERRVGAEAAARLEALDRRRADFAARLARYREARDVLEARGFADAAAREAALEALRAAHFREPERTRVRALDRLEAAGPAPPAS
jgi:lipase chaperone LimK